MDNTKELNLPLGPLHVALEEPMYFKVSVEGEHVTGVEITSGHVHRGMELLATKRNFFHNIVLVERVCSLCSNTHPLAYCMSLENLAKVPVPPRALYLRSLAEEIKRVASHLFNVSIMAHIIGYKSLFLHIMEVREIMQDVKETVYGNRMDLAANCIGGVKTDIDTKLGSYITQSCSRLRTHTEEIIKIFNTDKLILSRTKGVGHISVDDVLRYGLVGPVARGSGLATDIRKESPYGAYSSLAFDLITEEGGDVHARAMVRLREILESLELIKQIISDMPSGPIAYPLPVIPAGEAIARCEAPRGELMYYIRTDGSDIPLRLKWRVPTYMNWAALDVLLKGCVVADIALIVNSIDPCVSCTER